MKVTLELIRTTLRASLGADSFVAGFVSKVEASDDVPTLGINKEGILSYNPEFMRKVKSPSDLFSVLFHEVLHIVFQSFIYDVGVLENIGADAVINAVLSQIYKTETKNGAFFEKLYKKQGIEALLRPGCYVSLNETKLFQLYNQLYFGWRESGRMTTGDVIRTLKILFPVPPQKIFLVGSHGGKSGEKSGKKMGRLPAEISRQIAKEISANCGGRRGGYTDSLSDMLMEAARSLISLRRRMLQSYTTSQKIDRFRDFLRERRSIVSPIPIHPSKKDLVLLAAGIVPAYFHNQIHRPKLRQRGIAIYLDVSGSVNDTLPEILGILRRFQDQLVSIYLFSNCVVEIPMTDLLKGKLKTTYGTDFDCIAESILENHFQKAVIITDGYASMKEKNQEELKRRRVKTLTILFGRATKPPIFENFGDVISLKEATE